MRILRHIAFVAVVFGTLSRVGAIEVTQTVPPSGLPVGAAAPDFVAYAADKKETKLSDFSGKYVLVDFWATWCAPCRAAMPRVEAIHQKLKDSGLVVLGVCVADEKKAFAEWLASPKVPTSYSLLYDRAGRGDSPILGGYNISSIPSFFLIGPDGKVRYYGSGADEETEAGLQEALKAAGFKL